MAEQNWDSNFAVVPGEGDDTELLGWDSNFAIIPGEGDDTGSTGWDSNFAVIPGEDDNTGLADSGYSSSKDEPPKPLTKDEKDAIKYNQLPFLRRHYLLTYIQRILEETCVRYARTHLSQYFSNLTWKQDNLIFLSSQYQTDRLVHKNWLDDDEIELEYWMKTFAERIHGMPRSTQVYQAVYDLRNAAVHRGVPATRDDGNPMDPFNYKDLTQAMQLPHLLEDENAHEQISNALRSIMEDPALDEETRAAIEKEIHTPPPCTSRYQFLARIQTMLEETCFHTALRKIPNVLQREGWHCHEQLEITKYEDLFFRYEIYGQNDAFADKPKDPQTSGDSQTPGNSKPPAEGIRLGSYLNEARIHTRNVVHHRLTNDNGLLTDHGKLVKQTHNAISLCLLQGDWNQAIEIEILAEMFMTKTSREQVLRRLKAVYRVGTAESWYENRRRDALEVFLKKELGSDGEEKQAVAFLEDENMDVEEVKEGWKGRTWSPSMHGEVVRMEEMVLRVGFADEMEIEHESPSWEELCVGCSNVEDLMDFDSDVFG